MRARVRASRVLGSDVLTETREKFWAPGPRSRRQENFGDGPCGGFFTGPDSSQVESTSRARHPQESLGIGTALDGLAVLQLARVNSDRSTALS